MRITSSSYYNNIYGENNKLNRQLFDVNKQISSGQKIQYAHEGPETFIDTMRLDDEITTLTQIKNSSLSAYKISTQTDTTMSDMVKTLESMKVKLISAANDAHSDTSIQALAKELRGLQNHLLNIANSSIGGKYIFSGTAVSEKPIDPNGVYQGNDEDMLAFIGSGLKQKFNISGTQLFLGEESKVPRTISSNVPQFSLNDLYPDIMKDPGMQRDMSKETYISSTSTIRDLMGDNDSILTNDTIRQAHFYVQGTKTTGETFKTKISLNMDDTINDLILEISDAYGSNQVDVTINAHGQIEIADKHMGSSKLDFHMVGAVDFDSAGVDTADVTDINLLQPANNGNISTNNFADVVAPGSTKLLYVKEFTRSGYEPANPTIDTIEGINYDRYNFTLDGAFLRSSIPQIINSTNAYASPSSKLSEVAGASLNGKSLILEGNDIMGTAFTAQINFNAAGSTFTLNGSTYTIYTATTPRVAVPANDMTYQQLLDVVNIALSGTTPSAVDTDITYDAAITQANQKSSTTLDYAGRLVFKDNAPTTLANIAIYDASTVNYTISEGPILSFQANNTLTIRDPKKDFFAEIEEMIRSVEEARKRANGDKNTDPRNIGIQNAITKLDDLSEHVTRLQTEVGSYSQVLQATSDRTDLLIVSTKRLQSDVLDTDIAEASMRMQQLTLNYQALLSNISKVSKLSLVNYL